MIQLSAPQCCTVCHGAGYVIGGPFEAVKAICTVCGGNGRAAPAITERRALEMIASAAPTLHCCGQVERRCSVCATHIDLAREVLGMAPLPAAPGTPLVGETGRTP